MHFEGFKENSGEKISKLFKEKKFKPYGVCSDETEFEANVFPALVRNDGHFEVWQ